MARSATASRSYTYGNHSWLTEVQADFSKGMIRDTDRNAIPRGGVYDSADFMLHKPGVAQKRGPTAYTGPAMTAATYATGVTYAAYASGAQVLGVGENGHLYKVTSGTTTDVATLGAVFGSAQKPVLVPSSAALLAVFFANDGTTAPKKWDGAAAANLGGTPPAGVTGAVYKQRLVIGNSLANPNRVWFSPVPSVESTWDTANSYIDFEDGISGLAALNNTLLVFHYGSTERVVGATPPPNSDMDRALIWNVGASDSRSVVVFDDTCVFASPRGVYLTNGSNPVSLTSQGGIDSYWQNLFSGYTPTTWTISCGVNGQFLMVTVLSGSTIVTGLVCYMPTRAWWRVTNISAAMYSNSSGTEGNLYYADRTTNRIVTVGRNFFSPPNTVFGGMTDANGTSILPMLELAPFGSGPGKKSFGFGRADFRTMQTGAPTPGFAVSLEAGLLSDLVTTPAESPLIGVQGYTSDAFGYTLGTIARRRFCICRDSQAMTVKLTASETSPVTEVYAVEVEVRPKSMVSDGTL